MEASLESQFWPRLWEQRRTVVLSVLREHSALIDWVADLGCNTCGLASVLANSCDYAHISCVDLDPDMLAAAAVEPTEADLHQLRERPFIVDLFCGSIVGRDARLEGIDVVVLSEVIEHLDPGPLAALPRALFDFYRPKIVVVSTPNREFNVHFPNPRKVRDADHRFEWTRDEFKAWCDKAAADYGYTYTLTGCGTYPCCDRREHDDTGPATQFAVFMRPGATAELANKWPVAELTPPPPLLQHQRTQDSPWTFVRRVEYPWHKGPDLLPLFGPSSQSSNIDSQEDQGSLQQDLIEAVARALARISGAFHWCAAHSGHYLSSPSFLGRWRQPGWDWWWSW
ncbi:hypothetical protein BC828DRAFT_151963 [Blastocladiella britannica]|nr:hypothetical protein BC828DRAFT_151963 [Blastocladiella britannica]